jgi:hypothetical protein
MTDAIALRDDDGMGLFAFSEDRCATQGNPPLATRIWCCPITLY